MRFWAGLSEDETEILIRFTKDDGTVVELWLGEESLPHEVATIRNDRQPAVHEVLIADARALKDLLQ